MFKILVKEWLLKTANHSYNEFRKALFTTAIVGRSMSYISFPSKWYTLSHHCDQLPFVIGCIAADFQNYLFFFFFSGLIV